MADITKCTGEGCDSKHTCYRYTAKSNEYAQSYFMKAPGKDKSCNHYWER